MNRKSKVAAFVLSCMVPGTGHLYLGLNKTGLQFMVGFFACIVFIPMMPLVFPFALAIIWFYALFDALQKCSVLNAHADRRQGKDVQETSEVEDVTPTEQLFGAQNLADSPMWFGAVFIVVGILLMLRVMIPNLWQTLSDMHAGSIILALILIGFGGWLIRRQASRK